MELKEKLNKAFNNKVRIEILHGKLFEIGGNVGYAIRPSERKKGYATTLLGLLLDEFDKLGIENALVTCRENNIGSKKTMNKFMR